MKTHYFNWVSAREKDGKILPDLADLHNFKIKKYPCVIPYYVFINLGKSHEARLLEEADSNHVKAVNFREILKQDKLTKDWKQRAEQIEGYLQKIENSKSEDSWKICAIVDIMKLYMSAKNDSIALDFNDKLINADKYNNILNKNEKILLSWNKDTNSIFLDYCLQSKYPENKYIYINEKSKFKTEILDYVIEKLKYLKEDAFDKLDRDTIFLLFREKIQNIYDHTSEIAELPQTVIHAKQGEKSYVQEKDFKLAKATGKNCCVIQ
jgi:hypothetical protein